MRSKKVLSCVLAVGLALPNVALPVASAGWRREAPARTVLSVATLATVWGGEHPVSKIGMEGSYGFLELRRAPTFVFDPAVGVANNFPVNDVAHCGDSLFVYGVSVVPVTFVAGNGQIYEAPGPRCREALPVIPSSDGYIYVLIGGDTANQSPPVIDVYANAVKVPAAELGPYFRTTCPRLPGDLGTAFLSGGGSTGLYACSVSNYSPNVARIATSRFVDDALNVITVHSRLGNFFSKDGDDLRERVFYMD